MRKKIIMKTENPPKNLKTVNQTTVVKIQIQKAEKLSTEEEVK